MGLRGHKEQGIQGVNPDLAPPTTQDHEPVKPIQLIQPSRNTQPSSQPANLISVSRNRGAGTQIICYQKKWSAVRAAWICNACKKLVTRVVGRLKAARTRKRDAGVAEQDDMQNSKRISKVFLCQNLRENSNHSGNMHPQLVTRHACAVL